jgi:hypothetical protein
LSIAEFILRWLARRRAVFYNPTRFDVQETQRTIVSLVAVSFASDGISLHIGNRTKSMLVAGQYSIFQGNETEVRVYY